MDKGVQKGGGKMLWREKCVSKRIRYDGRYTLNEFMWYIQTSGQ